MRRNDDNRVNLLPVFAVSYNLSLTRNHLLLYNM